MGFKRGGKEDMKPVICIFLTENRNGPMYFGTNAECKKTIEINPEYEYIFIDIGIAGDELDCKRSKYNDYKNVRFVKISETFFKDTNMTSTMERVESAIFLIWNDYLKSQKMPYKKAGFDHCVWSNERYAHKINDLISALCTNKKPILHRSADPGFSQYGAFNIYRYEDMSEEELFNRETERVAVI
jgi:hypothetical protein